MSSASESRPAGGRRFWITVLCFAIANAAAWIGYHWLMHPRHALLEVQQIWPGDQSQVSGRPTFRWQFNLDVLPPRPDAPPPGAISPPVAGKWKWDGPRGLSFTPDNPLPKATPLSITLLPERLRTVDGFSLATPDVLSVHTAPLDVMALRQAALDERDRLVIEIEFNDEVLPAEMIQHLSLRSSEDKPVGFHLHGDAAGRIVRVMTDPLPTGASDNSQAYVKVRLSPGLAGRSGPLGMATNYEHALSIGSELAAIEANAEFGRGDEVSLRIRFNNPVDLSVLKPLVSVDPAVQFALSENYGAIKLDGPFEAATRYAIRIAKAPVGTPRQFRPRAGTLSVYVPDRQPSVWFEHEEGYLGSAGNRTLLAHAVNLTNLRVSITRVYDNNLVQWRNRDGSWRQTEDYSRPIASKDLKLSSEKNKTQDVRVRLDELLPAGAQGDGVYEVAIAPISPISPAAAREEEDPDLRWHGRARSEATSVITLSDIGLTAKQGRTNVTVWATSLHTAKSLGGVRVRLFSNKNQLLGQATTDERGLATISAVPTSPGEQASVILADRPGVPEGRDLTWLDIQSTRIDWHESDVAGAPYLRGGHEAFIYTDRGVYRPGETVYLRAIIRGPDGAMPSSFPVVWQFRRPDLHDWKSFVGQIDKDGAVSLQLPLARDLPTGRWSVVLGLPGHSGHGHDFGTASFQVEDFMPNRMQVGIKLEGEAIQLAGASSNSASLPRFAITDDDPLVAKVQADYLFGRPVTERPARLVARIDPVPFSAPQWSGWTFGDDANTAETLEGRTETGHRAEFDEETLDAHGRAEFDVALSALLIDRQDSQSAQQPSAPAPKKKARAQRTRERNGDAASFQKLAASPFSSTSAGAPASSKGPWKLTLTGSVIEASGRAVSASRQAIIDPLPWHIGVQRQSSGSDASLSFNLALVIPSGELAGRSPNLHVTLFRESWNNSLVYENGRYRYQSTRLLNIVQKSETRIEGGRAICQMQSPGPGSYVLRVEDATGGCMTSLGFYEGTDAWEDSVSRENPEKLDLIVRPMRTREALVLSLGRLDFVGAAAALHAVLSAPHSHKLRPGDWAEVIVRSPFAGQLLLSLETDDVLETRVIEMPASHMSVPIQIGQACRPGAFVAASVIRPIDPDAAWRTHRAVGVARIPIDQTDRKLSIHLDAPAEIRPAQSVQVRLRVTDSSGAPVRDAAVTLAAVDEGICQLTGFAAPDPFGFFTRKRALGVASCDLFSQLMPEVPRPDKKSPEGGDKESYDPRHVSPISAPRVKPVALVSGVLHTDENGDANVDFNVPQFIGKLRLMAVGSGERSYGSGEGAMLVRSPLIVQSSWPRFAAPGDRFTVPLLVFNNTPADGEVSLAIRIIDGPLELASDREAKLAPVKIKANGQIAQGIEIIASKKCGVARALLSATMGDQTFEEQIELPVRPASPEIAVGGYDVATPDAPASVSLAGGMLQGTERFQLRVTPWPSLELPRGLDYLERYPYGCLEQTTSTLFPLVYLSDIGQQIAPGVFEKDRVADKVQSGITRLIGMQTAGGGLAMWPGYREPWPWGSVYAAHFLVEAQNAGHEVPEEFRKELLTYVRGLLDQSSDDPEVLETQAYACYVLATAGKPDRPAMSRLAELLKTPRTDGVAHPGQARLQLAAAWLAAGRRDLADSLIPQSLPAPRASRSLGGTLGSPVRDSAILIDALLAVQPDHPALPQLVQRLADSGRRGGWCSTQDTAFAVLALGRYLRQSKSVAPYSTAELSSSGLAIARVEDAKLLVWDAAAEGKPTLPDGAKLQVAITGPPGSKAHISWLQSGVPMQPPAPVDRGMQVRRRLLDEHGQPLKSASVRSGDLIQMELTLSSDTPLQNVVIEDLLPAGLEIENPRLQTTAADAVNRPDSTTQNLFQDSRLDMQDDRLVLIGNLAGAGTGKYVYTARAVTPGKFVLPPVHAECMYDIGTNSTWGSGTFEVLAAAPANIANVQETER